MDLIAALISGLFQVFNWSTFSLMLIGIGVGFVVGILPGLGGPTTMALMLPFVFKMDAVEAFAFLLGMAAVTATTGDITSILFGVPGEPTTASTIVDGHPMAKNGEAGRALGAALMSSMVGAIIGALSLALAIPIVRPLVLSFGSPEFFMISLLGVTFVASLSGGNLLKGLISGGLGFLIATIGLDPISGIQRYTFDQLFLWDGIGLVPVTLGLFAIPEIIDLAIVATSIARQKVEKLGSGEILLTSMDKDGTKDGYDLPITRMLSETLDIPIIASGGAGNIEHMHDAFTRGKADAALAASIFHFGEVQIPDLKRFLKKENIAVRI